MISDDQVFLQQLRAQLTYKPNQHLINPVLTSLPGMPVYYGYSFNYPFTADVQPFMQVETSTIDKIIVTADISLFDERGYHFNDDFKGCRFEFYLVKEDGYYNSDGWLLLDLDDLLFYLNRHRNQAAITRFNFPELTSCDLSGTGFDFIMEGRTFRNKYFDLYKGPVFDTFFGDELKELFAIASNSLAFLYRTRDRVFEELDLAPNFNYSASLNLYPRFNNAIAEVAGTLYSAWERIAFLFNEFFPLFPNSKMAPSFKRYITEKVKEAIKDTRLHNPDLEWFSQRIDGGHTILETLRHPTVHYNKLRTPSGTRAVEMMKLFLTAQTVEETKQTWNKELEFLKAELEELNTGLVHHRLVE